MFIRDLYKVDEDAIKNDRQPVYRVQNIGWPSESLVSLPHFNTGECSRALFYKALGVPQSDAIPVRVRRICDIGLLQEDVAIEKFKKQNMFVDEQIKIEFVMPNTQNNVTLSGKMDCLIRDGGILRGIEIKTINAYKAAKIFGYRCMPLPAPNNLMQAMLYKYRTMQGPVDGHNIEEVYLMYIARDDGCTYFYKVDLDTVGFPIITPIDMEGRVGTTINLANMPSYDDLMLNSTIASSDQSRVAELRININDIFAKFDQTYSYIKERVLPPKDFSAIYTMDELDKQRHCGRLSIQKYNKHKRGTEECGDSRCGFCNYRTKCMSENGVRLKD